MQWIELTIKTAPAAIDLVCDRLTVLGFDSFIIDDQEQFHEFLEQNRQYWDYVDEDLEKQMQGLSQIRLYLEQNASVPETVESLKSQLAALRAQYPSVDFGSLDVQLANVKDEDWENNWKQYYKPMEIGERLLVIPEWEQENVKGQAKYAGKVPLILEPGLTFGTGSHATTRLCLTALEKHITGGQTVLDLGCGSGILSIAALLLGADHAVACDIDEKCMDVAYENAALNGVGRDRYTVRWGDVVTDQALRQELGGPYDVVVANIVADVIKALASTVRPLVKEGGIFLCSGIIDDRAEEVAQCLRDNGWTIAETRSSEGWFSYLCK